MRIVIVNWARIEEGAAHGGGVNGYCQGVALEMARRGHEVVSISSGTVYERGPGEPVGPCHIRGRGNWQGVRLYEVVNSPVLAPSILQFGEPEAEAHSPALEEPFSRWLREIKPNAVHFNNIEGFSAGCVRASLERGSRTIYSLHNYHTLCPQVYLMQGHRRPCMSFDNGHACTNCIECGDPHAERIRLALGQERPPGPKREPFLPKPPWETIDLPAWRPLANVALDDPPSDKPINAYGRRRSAMIAMLNSCHRVLAVSEFVKRKFEAMGVSPRVLKTMHIGTRMPASPARVHVDPGAPLRLAFVGYNNWYKGLPMLADSLELLTPEYLGRVHLTVLALNVEPALAQLRRLEPRLAGLEVKHGYRFEDLPVELAEIDLGVVPSVWWDNAPQTVMEFLACGIPVLAAELGGIPDFVRDRVNGLLFRGNDRFDLARRLAEVIGRREILAEIRAGVRPPETMSRHGTDLEQEYMNPLS